MEILVVNGEIEVLDVASQGPPGPPGPPGSPGSGSKGVSVNSKSTAYTTTAADFVVDTMLLHPTADTAARVYTIASQASVPLAAGAAIAIINQHGAGAITIAATTQTLRWVGGGVTGNRTLAADSSCVLIWMGDEWQISGSVGLT